MAQRWPETSDSPAPTRSLRWRLGLAAVILGILSIVVTTLQLASAGYGSRPKTDFARRRSYDMVKRDVHRSMPLALLQGLAGLGLVIFGTRQLGDRQPEEGPQEDGAEQQTAE